MGLPANIIGIMGKKQGYLPLTTAWIAATLETDTTILNALNTFEASLIANSMSSDLIAYYPMVGGDSTKHSYNFMNTSLYNLSFNGFWSHSANGALPNGTNAYADTGLNMNSVLTQNNAHVSFYSKTNAAAADRASIGGGNGSAPYLAIQTRITTGFATAFNSSATLTQYVRVTNANSNGFYLSNKTSTAIGGLTLDRNGSQIGANTSIITTNNYQSANLLISALTTTAQFDNKECAGVTVGLGLNATKRGQLYTMIQALNTSLSRQV
jgi:hypothetical protein